LQNCWEDLDCEKRVVTKKASNASGFQGFSGGGDVKKQGSEKKRKLRREGGR